MGKRRKNLFEGGFEFRFSLPNHFSSPANFFAEKKLSRLSDCIALQDFLMRLCGMIMYAQVLVGWGAMVSLVAHDQEIVGSMGLC